MIYFQLPSLPISTNHAYTNITIGKGKKKVTKRVLTKEGRKYKTETKGYIVQHYPMELARIQPDKPYGYIIQLSFPNLLNKGWPDTAKSRYKKLDASNRVKLLEDALSDALGIDDSCFLSTRADKVPGQLESTQIWLWNMEEECPYGGHV